MLPVSHGTEALERDAYRIVGLICAESASEAEIQDAIGALRAATAAAFPERPRLYDETYGRRFARLRTRFRPRSSLFAGGPPASI